MSISSNMQTFRLLVLLSIITSCNNSTNVKNPVPQNMEVYHEFHPFLTEGIYKVDCYVSKEVSSEHKKILKKISNIIQTNTSTQKFFQQYEKDESPPYNPSVGISRQEYNSLIELFSYKEPEKFNGTLKVLKNGNRYSFQGDNRLSILDSLFLDITNKSASYKMYNLSQVNDSIDLSNEDILKGDRLNTYEFYRGPDGILGLTGLHGVYELLIGKSNISGKTFLTFSIKQPFSTEHPIPEYIKIIF